MNNLIEIRCPYCPADIDIDDRKEANFKDVITCPACDEDFVIIGTREIEVKKIQ